MSVTPLVAAVAQTKPFKDKPFMEADGRLRLGRHECSVAALSKVIAATLGLDEAHRLCIANAAALHDVGKLYVSASVNEKCGPHNAEEMLAMQKHPLHGYRHLRAFKQTTLTRLAAIVALQHHENWDGTGYPLGLFGDRIAIESRIVSICDVYDALREDRSYRTGIGHNAAMQVITCGDSRTKLSMFDPAILNALSNSQERIRATFESRHPDNRI